MMLKHNSNNLEVTMGQFSNEETKPFHMNFSKILMTLIGLWPWELEGIFKILYYAYFQITFCYYVLFNISQSLQVYLTFGQNWLYTAVVLNVNIMYILCIYKGLICRSTPLKNILNEIRLKEIYYLNKCDENIRKICNDNANTTIKICRVYVLIGSCGISLYFLNPVVSDLISPLPLDNSTGIQPKRLIFASYFPFDENRHHLSAYWIQFVAGFIGYAYVVYTSAFFISILNFIIGRIKILQYNYRNFTQFYKKLIEKNEKTAPEAQLEFLKSCIKEHQDIIRFTDDFNDSLNTFCLLEYVTSSFQLSLVILQVIVSTGPIIENIAAFSFFLTLSLQLVLFYWSADEITAQAFQLGNAIFASEWYDYNIDVKKMLMVVILRSQRPVKMTIGPIYNMTVPALFQIYKTIYSLVALFMRH